ncbi:MAG: NAD-dependent epimerase/dehydratase family protein [Acetobacteraceae bacterium]|nr:NAD-dependent epimerase/dehydratase family protein [Acetobacteraceae bacterium]
MHVTILGGAGFLGRKLAERIAAEGNLAGRAISAMTLLDQVRATPPRAAFPVTVIEAGLDNFETLRTAMPEGTGVVFHLAAVVSAQAEADFHLGMRVNIEGTRNVLAAAAALKAPPRLVFTSSVATYSGGQDAVITDATRQVPANSYGAQKIIGELMVHDHTRKGFVDGISLRLPTIVVRPGRPNRAASSFASSILREPFLGEEAALPVPEDFALFIASPRSAVGWLLHAAGLATGAVGLDRSINPPGIRATTGEMLAALVAAGGDRGRVKRVDDKEIFDVVSPWPAKFDTARARALGFAPQPPLNEIIGAFLEDDLAATRALRTAGS